MSANSAAGNGLEEYSFEVGSIDDSSECVAIVGQPYSSVSFDEKFYRKEDVDALITQKDAEIEALRSRVAAYDTDDPPSYKLKVSAGIRYLEDATVNGQQDISYELQEAGQAPAMPLCVRRPGNNHCPTDMWLWELEIDPDTGTVANWPAGTTAHAHYKVCDECGIEYFRDGVKVCDNESGKCHGYVPRFLHYSPCYDSDCIDIGIGPDGRIKCWSKDWLLDWVERATAPKK